MRSSYHQVDDVVVLTIAGAIDTHAAAVEFEYLLAHVPGAGHLVLDLAEVTALGEPAAPEGAQVPGDAA
jgi:anti-anti-sigma regulatory factor